MWFLTSQEVGGFGIADDGDVAPEEETRPRLLCGLLQNSPCPEKAMSSYKVAFSRSDHTLGGSAHAPTWSQFYTLTRDCSVIGPGCPCSESYRSDPGVTGWPPP